MYTVSAAPTQVLKWYEVWREVVLHPSANTFERILADPTAAPVRAYAWVAIVSTLISVFGQIFNPDATTLSLLIYPIFVPIISLIGLAFEALILHWVAKRYHGQGSYHRMVYVLGAIYAPYGIIEMGLNMVLPSVVMFLFGIFMLYLQVQAIKAAERITTSQAYWTFTLPGLLLVVLTVFIIIALVLLGPALGAGIR